MQTINDPALQKVDDPALEKVTPHIQLKMGKFEKTLHLLVVVTPFIGMIVAMVLLWGYHFSIVHLVLLFVGYMLSAVGITVGYHRLFTHRSFETFGFMKAIFAILGSMALEGPVLQWAAQHRRHHQHSDDHDDPHSPHGHGHGYVNMIKGIWHAHVGGNVLGSAQALHLGQVGKSGFGSGH